MLVINQLIGEYECTDDILCLYHEECLQLLKEFKKLTIEHVPKFHNSDANRLAQHASGYRLMEGVMSLELAADDWRKESAGSACFRVSADGTGDGLGISSR